MSRLTIFQKQEIEQTEAVMIRFVCDYTNDPLLQEAMLYSIRAGGKRIRPLLLLVTEASFHQTLSPGAYQAAAALEMIHTYSLIHDDLPAMDNDDLRRGKLTNHKVFGEALAILAGDGLLTAAFELLSVAEIDAKEKVFLLQLLAKAAGTHGMVAGQAADMQAEGKKLSIEDLLAIHQRKTGALIQFALVAGGVFAQQPESVLEMLGQLAKHLGLAFQIRDDLLDVIGTTEEIGKQVHRDQALAKSTYPGLLGLAGAKKALSDELEQAQAVLDELDRLSKFDGRLLTEVCDLFRL